MRIKFQVEIDDVIYASSKEITEEDLDLSSHPSEHLAWYIDEAVSTVLDAAQLPKVYVV